MKEKLFKLVFKVPFIKKYYIGNEILKNPPTVTAAGKDIEELSFTNTKLVVIGESSVRNNVFINTMKMSKYF